MNEEHLNLIQAEIDGLNTDADSARVKSLITQDPELQTAYNELKAVKLAIESLAEKEPPATLRASIMNALPKYTMANSTAPETTSIWTSITNLIRTPKPVSLAYAFSLGLIVAFVVSTVFMPATTTTDSGAVVGTMGAVNMNGFQTIAAFTLQEEEEDEEEGQVEVHRSSDLIIVEFTWYHGRPVTVDIEYDDLFLDVIATRTEGDASNLTTYTGNGEVSLDGEGPLTEFVTLTVRDEEEGHDEMSLNVNSGGSSLLNTSIFLRK